MLGAAVRKESTVAVVEGGGVEGGNPNMGGGAEAGSWEAKAELELEVAVDALGGKERKDWDVGVEGWSNRRRLDWEL